MSARWDLKGAGKCDLGEGPEGFGRFCFDLTSETEISSDRSDPRIPPLFWKMAADINVSGGLRLQG